jgi:aminoglycoside/choline kinase family phosphotransferase
MSFTDPTREEALRAFIHASDWRGGTLHPLPGDASTRRYIRVVKDGYSAMLMDQPQNAETPSAGKDTTPEERRRLGYNAVARLAGADCARFAAVGSYLRRAGLAAPELYSTDFAQGFILMEDFGDSLYPVALSDGADEYEIYSAAIDVLVALHREPAPDALGEKPLFEYDETALLAETDVLAEWFLPMALGRHATSEETQELRAHWHDALQIVLKGPDVFVHRDYHAQNLIWMPERMDVERVGLVDFQDAVAGHPAYDLISLLEDARRDVSDELASAMTERYLTHARPADVRAFKSAAAILAAQRNAKIIGIFARLAKRDGKPRYLAHLPRVWRYMEKDLTDPSLEILKSCYDRLIPREARLASFAG